MKTWTTLEAARFLDDHGYDCSQTREPIKWKVIEPNGKRRYYWAHELCALAEHVREETKS